MEKKLMSDVFCSSGYVWINIPKCASSFFKKEFIKKINKKSNNYFWFSWKEETSHHYFRKEFENFIKNSDTKLKLLVHIRDPWDRFKASVRQDIKAKYQNKDINKNLILEFCKNVESRYTDFNFENPRISLSSELYKHEGWNLLFLKMADRVFNILDVLRDYIDSVEIWKYENIEESIKEKFGFNCSSNKRNKHSDSLKEIVDNFFNNKQNFIQDWKKINSNDLKLFDVIGAEKTVSLDIRTFTKLFFKKDNVFPWR